MNHCSTCSGATRHKEPYEQYAMSPDQQFGDTRQVVFAHNDFHDGAMNGNLEPEQYEEMAAGMGVPMPQYVPPAYLSDPYANLYMQHSFDAPDMPPRAPPGVAFAGLSFLPQPQQQPAAAIYSSFSNNNNNHQHHNNNHLAYVPHAHQQHPHGMLFYAVSSLCFFALRTSLRILYCTYFSMSFHIYAYVSYLCTTDVNRSSLDSGLSTDSPNAQLLLNNVNGYAAGLMPMQLANGQAVHLMGGAQAMGFAADTLPVPMPVPAAELYQLQNVPPPTSTSIRARRDNRTNSGAFIAVSLFLASVRTVYKLCGDVRIGSNPRLPGSGRATPLPLGVASSSAAAVPPSAAAARLQHCPNCPCYHCTQVQSLQQSRPLTPLVDGDLREAAAAGALDPPAAGAGSHSTSGRGSNEERSLDEAHTLQTFGRAVPTAGSTAGDSQSQDASHQIVEVVV